MHEDNNTMEFTTARVSITGANVMIIDGILTIPKGSGVDDVWHAPIYAGDAFKICSPYDLTGHVSHVIHGGDGGIKHICLIFDGKIHFEGDLSDAEFQIPA